MSITTYPQNKNITQKKIHTPFNPNNLATKEQFFKLTSKLDTLTSKYGVLTSSSLGSLGIATFMHQKRNEENGSHYLFGISCCSLIIGYFIFQYMVSKSTSFFFQGIYRQPLTQLAANKLIERSNKFETAASILTPLSTSISFYSIGTKLDSLSTHEALHSFLVFAPVAFIGFAAVPYNRIMEKKYLESICNELKKAEAWKLTGNQHLLQDLLCVNINKEYIDINYTASNFYSKSLQQKSFPFPSQFFMSIFANYLVENSSSLQVIYNEKNIALILKKHEKPSLSINNEEFNTILESQMEKNFYLNKLAKKIGVKNVHIVLLNKSISLYVPEECRIELSKYTSTLKLKEESNYISLDDMRYNKEFLQGLFQSKDGDYDEINSHIPSYITIPSLQKSQQFSSITIEDVSLVLEEKLPKTKNRPQYSFSPPPPTEEEVSSLSIDFGEGDTFQTTQPDKQEQSKLDNINMLIEDIPNGMNRIFCKINPDITNILKNNYPNIYSNQNVWLRMARRRIGSQGLVICEMPQTSLHSKHEINQDKKIYAKIKFGEDKELVASKYKFSSQTKDLLFIFDGILNHAQIRKRTKAQL